MRNFVLALAIGGALRATARDYYFSGAGSDAGDGSPGAPMRTIDKANSLQLHPGDRMFFKAGETFDGGLIIGDTKAGTLAAPIDISSYGNGVATLRNMNGHGFFIYNAGFVRVTRLNIAGEECGAEHRDCRRSIGSGILLGNYYSGDVRLDGVMFKDLEIYGFNDKLDAEGATTSSGDGGMGILVRGAHGHSGYKNLWIENVKVHDNAKGGITLSSDFPNLGHQNVTIRNVEAYNNTGIPGLSHHTGNGILVGGTDGALIENCYAHDNGTLNDFAGGPSGIWASNGNKIIVRKCTSMRNWTRGQSDGSGFDFDGGVTNSVMEYNYSERNAGPGYVLAQFKIAPPYHDNIVRFNTSIQDGQRESSGGIVVWGNVNNTWIHDNLVVTGMHGASYVPGGITFYEWTGTGVYVQKNKFFIFGGTPFVNYWQGQWTSMQHGAVLSFDQNYYTDCSGNYLALYGDEQFHSMDDWRAFSFDNVKFEPSTPPTIASDEKQKTCTNFQP